MEPLIFLLALLFVVMLIIAVRSQIDLEAERVHAKTKIELAQQEVRKFQIEAANWQREFADYKSRELELGELEQRITKANTDLQSVQEALAVADRLLEDKEIIIFPRRFPEETSAEIKERMDNLRSLQAEIRRMGQVVVRFEDSLQNRLPSEERIKLKNLVRLTRLAIEGAVDALLDQVKASNLAHLEKKLSAVITSLNRLIQPWGFEIGKNYQATVREMLELLVEYQQQVEKEREEQRALREQMREEAAALREAERAQKEAEAEERRALRELKKAQEAADKATLEERNKWLEKVHALEAALSEAQSAKARAVAMAQLTRSGHVYIISNIGSFGEEVFKIGMTRRLDPLDRILELGDASVPFPFDIHGMISSTDAPELEASLHRALEGYRMNLVNERKEFFRVPFAAINSEITRLGVEVKLTELAVAAEYRQSQVMRKGVKATSTMMIEEHGAEEPDDIAVEMS